MLAGVEMLDEDGEVSSDVISFEEGYFFTTAKSTVNAEDYPSSLTYLKGFSREFLAYFGPYFSKIMQRLG